MTLKTLDKIIIVFVLVAIMVTSVSAADRYISTLDLGPHIAFYGQIREYEGTGNIQIYFQGRGSYENLGRNVIELYEREWFIDWNRGYKYTNNSPNLTWTGCENGNYRFWFYNNGSTPWTSDSVYMRSW